MDSSLTRSPGRGAGSESARVSVHCIGVSSNLDSGVLQFLPLGTPVQSADPPKINQGREEDADEYQHLDVSEPSGFAKGDGPSEDENGFQIENDEKDRDRVKPYAEAYMNIAD